MGHGFTPSKVVDPVGFGQENFAIGRRLTIYKSLEQAGLKGLIVVGFNPLGAYQRCPKSFFSREGICFEGRPIRRPKGDRTVAVIRVCTAPSTLALEEDKACQWARECCVARPTLIFYTRVIEGLNIP